MCRQALRFEEALVLLRERWQMELLYKLWKQHGQVDEWHTRDPWRMLCELYAKLLGVTLQHWLIVLVCLARPAAQPGQAGPGGARYRLDAHGGVGWLSLPAPGFAADPAAHAVGLSDEQAAASILTRLNCWKPKPLNGP